MGDVCWDHLREEGEVLHVLAENTAHQDYQVVVDGFHGLGSREESRRSKGAKSAHGGTGVKRRRQYPGAHNEYAVHVLQLRLVVSPDVSNSLLLVHVVAHELERDPFGYPLPEWYLV